MHRPPRVRSFSDHLKCLKGISLSITTLSKIFKKQGIPSGTENYQEQVVQDNPRKAELLEKEVLSELNQWERFEGEVYLVDIIDDFSRFLIGWGLFREQTSENVITVLTEAINRHGFYMRITDILLRIFPVRNVNALAQGLRLFYEYHHMWCSQMCKVCFIHEKKPPVKTAISVSDQRLCSYEMIFYRFYRSGSPLVLRAFLPEDDSCWVSGSRTGGFFSRGIRNMRP